MISTPLQGRRIGIIGNSGSGKSTLARTLSARLNLPHIELDALTWQPGWRALHLEDPGTWSNLVKQAVAGDEWITDGNYTLAAVAHIFPRATDVVWLDYSRAVIIARVLRRSCLRALTRQELWPGTGNREGFRDWLQKDHPIRWTWDTYNSGNAARLARVASPDLAHARKHRLRTRAQTQRWLSQQAPFPGGRCIES